MKTKKYYLLSIFIIILISGKIFSQSKLTIARRMKVIVVDIESEAPTESILNGKFIADEIEKSILESPLILENIIPVKRANQKEISDLKVANILTILKAGKRLNVEGIIAGKIKKNNTGKYDIQIQLIDVQQKDIPSSRRTINFAEVKDIEPTAESFKLKINELKTIFEQGSFPRIDIITPNFDIVSIIQINKDNFPDIKLSVSVVNNNGDPVSVPPDLFEIRENGNMVIANIQKVESQSEIYLPITVLLVIDRSPSMLEELDGRKTGKPFARAKSAALDFIDELNPKDKIKIIGFDYDVLPLGDYTTDKKYYKDKLNNLKVGKGTGLYNALKYAANDIDKITGEKAVILLTDGKNDVRRAKPEIKAITLNEGLTAAKKNTIPIYTIGFGGADKKVLNQIAKETHSMFFKATSSEKLRELYLKIHRIIENQYIINYRSLADKKGKVHVSLNVKDDEREFILSEDEQAMAIEYKKERIIKKENKEIELKKQEIESVKKQIKNDQNRIEKELKDLKAEKIKSSERKKELSKKENELNALLLSLNEKEKKIEEENQKLSKLRKDLEKKRKTINEIEKNILETNTEILNYLKEKINYIDSEKKKLDQLNDETDRNHEGSK